MFKKYNQLIENYGHLAVALGLLAIGMCLLIINANIAYFQMNHVDFNDQTFTYVSRQSEGWTYEDENGETLVYNSSNNGFKITKNIRYRGHDLIYELDRVTNHSIFIFDDQVLTDTSEKTLAFETFMGGQGEASMRDFFSRLNKSTDYIRQIARIGAIAYGFVFLCLGVIQFVFSNLLWQWKTFLIVKGGEPTNLYLIGTKVSGGLIMLIGIFIPYYIASY